MVKDAVVIPDVTVEDIITICEIARVAINEYNSWILETLDISDEEGDRIKKLIDDLLREDD